MCWSQNSKKAYKSRWKRYYDFCEQYEIIPIPASITTVCLFITHLTKSVSYVTIRNYISSLWLLHDQLGETHVDPAGFLIKSTMNGAKRVLGCATRQVDPLSPQNLQDIYKQLDMELWCDFTMWCAICLCYRCLLRVSHISVSPHNIRVKDVTFWRGGMDIKLRSSKTIQYQERTQLIPVVQATGSVLCPVGLMYRYLTRSNLGLDDVIFPFTYKTFSLKLSALCTKAKLEGDFSTHSLRRGAATYLASFLPLHEVKQYGDWRSLAVLLYISDNYKSRREKDLCVAHNFKRWC